MIEFKTSGGTASGYFVSPKATDAPGVIVLPAWWGLTDFFKGFCDRLAAEGFVALAPDLCHGKTASTISDAKKLRSKMKGEVIKREILGALNHLLKHSTVAGHKVGAVGFSLGAYWALWLATDKPQGLSAVVVFYGARSGNYSKTRAGFLGHFAEDDTYAPVRRVRELERRILAAKKEVTFHIYPRTKHWFFENDRPDVFNGEAAQLAWNRTVEFLRTRLA